MSLRNVFATTLVSSLILAVGCGGSSSSKSSTGSTPAVTPSLYTENNDTAANAVLAYSRASNGSLTLIGTYPTGGTGVGLPTYAGALPFPIGGATGAVTLSPNGNFLYAVDAGSADVAAFSVAANGSLTLIGRYPTGGTSPSSITLNSAGNYLYVMNSGSVSNGNNVAGGITGFSVGTTGALTPLAGSTQALSSKTNYVDSSEVAFSPDGTYLVVTEKLTSLIDIYPVTNGIAGAPVSVASDGSIPFGFTFTSAGSLIVANVESLSSPNASTVSSYTPSATGTLTSISNQVPNNQTATCWISLAPNGQYAYTSNTLAGTVSGYTVGSTGALTLSTSNGIAASLGSTTGPIDLVTDPEGNYLYVLASYAGASPGAVAGFSIGTGGSLTSISTGISGLEPGTIGLAVR
jgi:6-phosphogluconolactonase